MKTSNGKLIKKVSSLLRFYFLYFFTSDAMGFRVLSLEPGGRHSTRVFSCLFFTVESAPAFRRSSMRKMSLNLTARWAAVSPSWFWRSSSRSVVLI